MLIASEGKFFSNTWSYNKAALAYDIDSRRGQVAIDHLLGCWESSGRVVVQEADRTVPRARLNEFISEML